jgi:AraC-like DNA-binding protein
MKLKYYKTDTDLTFVLTDKPDFEVKEHTHVSKYIVGLVLSGVVQIGQNEKEYSCKKDDFFIIPMNVAHTIQIMDQETKFLSMCVGKEFLSNYAQNLGSKVLFQCTSKLCEQNIIDEKNAQAFFDALDIILQLHYESTEDTEFQAISVDMVLHPEKNYPLEKLAKEIYVSKFNLVRKFKEQVGLTPHSFLVQNRIRKAKEYLGQKKSVTEVAAEVGFFDQSHFVKAFKSVVGITPSEYMKSIEKLG